MQYTHQVAPLIYDLKKRPADGDRQGRDVDALRKVNWSVEELKVCM
jgi:hypothetical protein